MQKEKPPNLTIKRFMARQEGFEPPTLWFVARYSIQLSYWRLFLGTLYIIPQFAQLVKGVLLFF